MHDTQEPRVPGDDAPCDWTIAALGAALQIVGRHGDDANVLAIGAAFEAATDHSAYQPAFA